MAFLKLSLSILITQHPSCHSRALGSICEIHIRIPHYHGLILLYLSSLPLLSSFPPFPVSPLYSTHAFPFFSSSLSFYYVLKFLLFLRKTIAKNKSGMKGFISAYTFR